ncbi:LysM domain-containing protein [Microbacterium oryzae]|uniref:LysM domain-containing protein n=1 Tax=Microbacterium oryzae TaxID=743009 RepID=A0A6I6DYL5_9MICO|nr:LysM domain-containing protein [Microbacterium oryzae]
MVALAAMIVPSLTGCFAPSAQMGPDAKTQERVVASPSPTPEPTPAVPPDGTVATGVLVDDTGSRLGEVSVDVKDGAYWLHLPLPAFEGYEEITPALSDSPFTLDECGAANIWQLGFGGVDDTKETYDVQLSTFYDDPSFFTSALYVATGLSPEQEEAHDGCWQPILAKADLHWTAPVVRPWAQVEDAGPASGARGTTEMVDARLLYTTAGGDTWASIAARFGVSEDDLEWMNPIRIPGDERMAYARQVLNLDPENRGDSESRRPQ